MDIVVTIPKSRQAAVEAEEAEVAERLAAGETDIQYYWTLSRLPKRFPNRIYFLWDGAIRAYHDVVALLEEPSPRILMRPEIHPVEPILMKGFQGFRYLTEEQAQQLPKSEAVLEEEERERRTERQVFQDPFLGTIVRERITASPKRLKGTWTAAPVEDAKSFVGGGLLEAGYVFAPYIPLLLDCTVCMELKDKQLIWRFDEKGKPLEDLAQCCACHYGWKGYSTMDQYLKDMPDAARKRIAERYAKKMVNPEHFGTIEITKPK